MKCHYEVLEVPRDADDSQIKTSYRKLALMWHPDKNLDNSEAAKVQFQLVQQAYEILSDRQERAWYDNHRDQILRANNAEFKDETLDVFQYFTTTCFKGYNDDEEGFYTVYRKVFEELAREDIEFMDDKEEFCEIPVFGTSTSDYDQTVGPFYAFWTSYSTKKSYVWLDPHNSFEMRDRKLFKLVEKENKKVRQKAKKERNEEIRALVAFVRKRDKRVQEYSKKLEAKILENRQKQEELSKQKRLKRKKELDESQSQAEWTKFDNVKNELEQIEKHLAQQFGEEISDDESDEAEELNNLYCVACNKVFKTPKAFENHESSKKHKENVAILKETMLDDSEELDESENSSDVSSAEELKNPIVTNMGEEFSEQEEFSDEQLEESKAKQKKKQKKSKNIISVNLSDNEQSFSFHTENTNDSKHDDLNFSFKKQKKKNKKSNMKLDKTETEVPLDTTSNGQNEEDHEDTLVNGTEMAMRKTEGKVKKSKKFRERRDKREPEGQVDVDVDHYCVMCKADFPSKNKLFDHLKKTGHSVYLQQNIKGLKNKKKSVKEK